MRTVAAIVSVVALASCGLDGGPPLEATYREARAVIDETARDPIGPYPVVAAGPPVADECHAPYDGPTGEWQVTYELYVEYETRADVEELLAAVARAWEDRGLEVARFETGVVVFPNAVEYRLDFDELPHARRLRLKASTSCLPPATQDLPQTIPDLDEDPRDLRGPAARPAATTADAVDWIGRLLEAAAAAVSRAEPKRIASPEPATCYGYSPETFSESVDAAVVVDDVDAALEGVAATWRDRGLDVTETDAGGGPTVMATGGDLALRARADDRGTLFLHGTTPCLPPE